MVSSWPRSSSTRRGSMVSCRIAREHGAGVALRHHRRLFLVVIWRHGRRWHLGKDPMQLALVLAAAMSVAAVLSFEHGKFAQLSWWDYHAYLLAGFRRGRLRRAGPWPPTERRRRRARRRVRRRSVRAHRPRLSRGAVDAGARPSRSRTPTPTVTACAPPSSRSSSGCRCACRLTGCGSSPAAHTSTTSARSRSPTRSSTSRAR